MRTALLRSATALATKASGNPVLVDMASRCSLAQPFQQWMIAYAMSTNFTEPPSQMLELAEALSQCWLQSRINEQGNKLLRDSELKTSSKVGERGGIPRGAQPPHRGNVAHLRLY